MLALRVFAALAPSPPRALFADDAGSTLSLLHGCPMARPDQPLFVREIYTFVETSPVRRLGRLPCDQ